MANTTRPKPVSRRFRQVSRDVDVGDFSQSIIDELRQLVRLDEVQRLHVSMALYEAITNALDHGNLELTSALIDLAAAKGEDPFERYVQTRQQRLDDPTYATRTLTVEIEASSTEVHFTVSDQGTGFDYENLPDPNAPENVRKPYGRGLLLIRSLMDDVRFNERGNAITFIKRVETEG